MSQQSLFDLITQTAPPPEQKTAPRNIVIEAGAGTGKTTAIVAEVLRLMGEHENLAPERIVLMTFTEKAAGEIADRIRTALEELSASTATGWPIGSPNPLVTFDDAKRARLAHHLENIDALRSQTIHSFCQSLLRGFPIEAGLDPQFKIIEGFERSLLYGQVYDAWVDHETRVSPTPEIVHEWELLFAHVGYLFMIREIVMVMLNRRDLLNETDYDFGDFDEIRGGLLEVLTAIRRSDDDNGDEHARRIYAYVRATPPDFTNIEECIAYLQPIGTSVREANLPRKGLLKPAIEFLRAGAKGRSLHDRLVSHRAAMALLALTRRFIAFLDEEKRKLGVVDFDDLLLRTLALLDDPAVLARARSQFDYIFVDEFQDTDRTQARIIDKLARDANDRYVPGKTIVVGDPKQSIYGFRRADPETYYRMTEDLVRHGAEPRKLTDQYRSDPALLDAINALFARLFPNAVHDPNVFRPAYHALRAARTSSRRTLDARVTMLHAQHEDRADRYFVEAETIAEWIRANRDGSAHDLQRFAILFRRLTKLDDYLDTFDRYGIDYVLPPTRLFLDRRAPVELLAVLRAIAYPFDSGAQISAARSAYFALTDDEIVHGMMRGEQETWTKFTASIARFREAARHATVSELIDLVIRTTNIERVYETSRDGQRHLRHLEHVRAIAFQYDQNSGGSVRQFVDEIERRRSEPEEMEPSLADESQNAVRILWVHAAKGLEFETVILPDLSFPIASSDAMQLFTVEEPRSIVLAGRAESISGNFRNADGEKLKKISGFREEAEMRRLFYVAVTRAKTDVVFVCNTGEDTKNTGFMKCLTEGLGVDFKSLASLWNADGREVRDTTIGPVAFEKRAVQGATERVRPRLHDAAIERELASSPIVPIEIPVPEVQLEIATRGRNDARRRVIGTLLHRVLELWDWTSNVEPVLQQAANEFAAEGIVIGEVRKRLRALSASQIFVRIRDAEQLGREFPIRFVDEHGALVERRIDRLIRENDRELVIDYKTGTPDDVRLQKDREQVARYCDAIRAITGRECEGLIWYVQDDRAEEVRRA
ncbi:MAG: UvrD-helicase domain-containing protein [Thermoanaerobaculia bacterium]